MLDYTKYAIINIFTAILAYISPIQDFIMLIVILFIMDFFFGLLADIIHGEGWNKKKARHFLTDCLLFFSIITMVFACGRLMHNPTETIYCVKYIAMATFYIFTLNILKNFIQILKPGSPMHLLISFIYYVLTLQMLEKLPYYKEWKAQKQKQNIQIVDSKQPQENTTHE